MNLLNVSIVGKPNVGKSTFFNKIFNEEISKTGDQPGTISQQMMLLVCNRLMRSPMTLGIVSPFSVCGGIYSQRYGALYKGGVSRGSQVTPLCRPRRRQVSVTGFDQPGRHVPRVSLGRAELCSIRRNSGRRYLATCPGSTAGPLESRRTEPQHR